MKPKIKKLSKQFSSYRSILKTTTVFGGVKALELFVNMAKVKLFAVLLGPSGMGVYAMFQTAISTIIQLTSLGVFQSSVREIAIVNKKSSVKEVSFFLKTFKKLVFLISIGAGVLTICLSPLLSHASFGNYDYLLSFALLSIAVIFYLNANYYISLLQGLRKLSALAKASLISSVINLLLSTTLFYFYGIKGIAPSFILAYLTLLCINHYFSRDIKLALVKKPKLSELISVSKPIIKLGVVLMISNVLMSLFKFTTNSFIRYLGNIEDVGYYQAALTLTHGNIIIIMQVLAADYYPRLSSISHLKSRVFKVVNEQVELIVLLIAPIVVLLIILAPYIIKLFLTEEFIIITPILRIMSVSLLFKSIWHALSYLILAKGDRKAYFVYDALIGNGFNFIIGLISYYYYGLIGLSISFFVGTAVMFAVLSVVSYKKYNFTFSLKFIKTFLLLMFLCLGAFISTMVESNILFMVLSWIILIVTITICVYILNKRINFKSAIKQIKGRNN